MARVDAIAGRGISWSPHGGALAFAGPKGIGAVAVHGHTTRVLFWRRLSGYRYAGDPPVWSPNGRYLIFIRNLRDEFTLLDDWIWDRVTGRTWLLARSALSDFNSLTWSHDSSRVALGVQQSRWSRPPAWKPVAEWISIQSGAIHRLGRGAVGPWSPDDRFIGFDRLWACGATGCIFQEGIIPASGGRFTSLTRAVRTWDADERWAPHPHGYAYDRWLLDRQGHVLRRIPGQYVNVDSWSPDGRWVNVRSVTSTFRIVLTLVSARTLQRTRIYVSGVADTCDECIHADYDVTWNHASTAFAMVTPYTRPIGGKAVKARLYVYAVKPGRTASGLSKVSR